MRKEKSENGNINEDMGVFCNKHLTAAGIYDWSDCNVRLHITEKAMV